MSVSRREKVLFDATIPVTDLPQHPADRLVNQVVIIVEQYVGDRQCVREVVAPDVMIGGHHRNAPRPEMLRRRHSVKSLSAPGFQPGAHDQMRGAVDKVPIVHVTEMPHIDVKYSSLLFGIPSLETIDEGQQRKQPDLVPG